MNDKNENENEELPDNWWYRVYFAVIVTTVAVIFLLWLFSYHYSK